MDPNRSHASTKRVAVIGIAVAALLMIAPGATASEPTSPAETVDLDTSEAEDLADESVDALVKAIGDSLDEPGVFDGGFDAAPIPGIVRSDGGGAGLSEDAEAARSAGTVTPPAAYSQPPSEAGVRSTQAVSGGSTPIGPAETGSPSMAYALSLAAGLALFLAPISMYRRVKKSKALDNDVRNAIFKYVESNPGATITEIAEGVGVSHSTATYHIKILTEFDLISKRRDGNSLHIFPSDAGLGSKEALLLSYMRDRETREIIRSVYANPWTYPSELARSLDMSRSSAQWHLEKLEDSGIVNVVRDGKFSYLYIDPDMKGTVEDHLVQ